jgi:quercetin dioxygenase-like cupin family protein
VHAVEAGVLTRNDVSQLGDVLIRTADGRQSGPRHNHLRLDRLAIQDLAIALAAMERVNELDLPNVRALIRYPSSEGTRSVLVLGSVLASSSMISPQGIEARSLDSPDAIWTFLDESERAAVNLGRVAIGRGNYRPGWRWSQHVQPLSGKDSAEHIGYVISGRMRVRAKDATEIEVGPGEAFIAAPSHDAWVVGDEPCIALDFIPM